MTEKIGLIAELDLSGFNRNVTTYVRKVGEMATATANAARTINDALSGASSTGAVGQINQIVGAMKAVTTAAEKAAKDEANAAKRAADAAIAAKIKAAAEILRAEQKSVRDQISEGTRLTKEYNRQVEQNIAAKKREADRIIAEKRRETREIERLARQQQRAIADAIGKTSGFLSSPGKSISGGIIGGLGGLGGQIANIPGAIIGTILGTITTGIFGIITTIVGQGLAMLGGLVMKGVQTVL